MFNKGGTSAYGRGIASNLVTEEQRIRYNTGGRVNTPQRGLVNQPGGYAGIIQKGPTGEPRQEHAWWSVLPWIGKGIQKAWKPITAMAPKISKWAKTPATGWGSGELGLAKKGVELATPVAKGAGSWFKKAPLSSTYGLGLATSGIGEERDFSIDPRGWIGYGKSKEEEVPGEVTDEFGDAVNKIIKDSQVQELEQKKEKKLSEVKDKKDPNVIDLTDSERAGLKATLYAGAGAGALDPSNKTVADVLRNTLLGASKAGEKIYDPTTERKYRKYAEAHTNIQDEAFKRKTEWETSDEKLMTERAATLGKQGALEEATVGKQVPKTGTGAEYQTVKKSITKSKKKGKPLAGLVVFDTDIQKYKVWDTDRKEYRTVSDNIDDVKKLLRG
jgi:hypothetical protein